MDTLPDSLSFVNPSENIVRACVTIRGTRPLLQHAFGPHAIPLQKAEREGVAGNDPGEWRRFCLVTPEGQLYLRDDYVFGCLRDAAKYTKKGRGSIQSALVATLQVEESVVLLDRWLPEGGDPPASPSAPVYIDIGGVKNPTTKARNVRYRLACSPGWQCSFALVWDKTLVSRQQMQAVLRDASLLVGIGDGRSIGKGRFQVLSYKELTDAPETTTAGGVAEPTSDRVAPRRKKVRPVSANGQPQGASS